MSGKRVKQLRKQLLNHLSAEAELLGFTNKKEKLKEQIPYKVFRQVKKAYNRHWINKHLVSV